MKIGILSTHPPQHCGIGTYTQALSRSMSDLTELVLLCEDGGKQTEPAVPCVPAFNRKNDYVNRVLDTVKQERLDLVHVQYAPDIFGMDLRMVRLLRALQKRGIATVITLHTVYTALSGFIERKPQAPLFHFMTGTFSDAIIAHQESIKRTLVRHGVNPGRIHVLPHGTDRLETGDPNDLRTKLNIPGQDRVLLFFGFVHIQKNVGVLIKMMPRVLRHVPNARLLIAGEVAGGTWYNRLYMKALKAMVMRYGLQDRVTFVEQYIPGKAIKDYYALADVALHPHLQGYGSASGAAHLAVATDVPALCSDIPKFEDMKIGVSPQVMLPPRSPGAWADAVVRLLTDAGFKQRILQAQAAFRESSSWDKIAMEHTKIYKNLR